MLGIIPLAGLAFGFPMFFLLLMLSAGTIGGAITGSIAQRLGARDKNGAEDIAVSAFFLNIFLGALSAFIFLVFGEYIYKSLGATGQVLNEALKYSDFLFTWCFTVWIANGLAGVVRATGRMYVSAFCLAIGAIVQVITGAVLIFGFEFIPGMGIAGSALSIGIGNGVAASLLTLYLVFICPELKLNLSIKKIKIAPMLIIVRLGSLASINAFCTWGSVIIITANIAKYGTDALAGYGIGARLEFLIIPIVFGFGAASTALIGIHFGANKYNRALKIGWIAALYSAIVSGSIGLLVSFFPNFWASAFTKSVIAREVCELYLQIVGPFYLFFAIGLCLYFSSQGAGRVIWPAIAAIIRLLIVLVGSMILSRLPSAPMTSYFVLISAAFFIQALITSSAIYLGAWTYNR
jgi:putative MATE family efflux protein